MMVTCFFKGLIDFFFHNKVLFTAIPVSSTVCTIRDESGLTFRENYDYYNTGPAYTPYSPSAPPMININSTGSELIISQPLRSDHEIIYGSNNLVPIIVSNDSGVTSQNEPLTPPPKYSSLFPES